MPNKLFVFDIETVPDTDVLKELTGSSTTDETEKRKELEQYSAEVSAGNTFPRQPFHRVVSVSILLADIKQYDGYDLYSNLKLGTISSVDCSEEKIVEKFFDYICKYTPKIVSYNGKTFDLPVMKYRAMKYGISAENLFKAGDKWNNYSQKYGKDWHCDLLDVLSDFGASAICKMSEVCAILGIPGKIGVDGSKVADMYDAKKFKEIDDYCETDVLNTYLIYLNYCLLSGIITKDIFEKMNKDLIEFLQMEIKNKNKGNYSEFLQEWQKTDTRNLF